MQNTNDPNVRKPTDFKVIEAVFEGKYDILRVIGSGGMSFVYLAMDKRMNKQWAIKEVRKGSGKDKAGRAYEQTLVVEANLMKDVDHPAIPRVVDINESRDAIYVVMDYVEGESLDKVVWKYGPQPQDVVIDWIKQIADALSYLHSRTPPVIYRDMKPPNIMLKPDGAVKLIDFGTARTYKGTKNSDTTNLGTLGYAAPEQYGNRETDGRTDIYSLGMTMHYLLTGQDPSRESPPYIYYPVRYWRPEIHEGIERIIDKCTRADMQHRYQSCDELLYALEHYEEDTEVYRKKQRKKVGLFFGTLALSGVMLLTSVGTYFGAQAVRSNDYDELIRSRQYEEAIELMPTEIEAYQKLINEYYSDGEDFDQARSDTLYTLIAKYETEGGDITDENYLEVLFEAGRLNFTSYTENGERSIAGQMERSNQYFKKIHDILKNNKKAQFQYEDIAENLYIITNAFTGTNGAMSDYKEYTSEQLEEVLDAFEECMRTIDEASQADEGYKNILKLRLCSTMADLINAHKVDFSSAQIPKSRLISLLEDIMDCESSVNLEKIKYEREKAIDDCAIYIENVKATYG